MVKIKKLTNEELRSALAEYGEDVGPIMSLHMRKSCQKRLRKLRIRYRVPEERIPNNNIASSNLTSGKENSKMSAKIQDYNVNYSDNQGFSNDNITCSVTEPFILHCCSLSNKDANEEDGDKIASMQNFDEIYNKSRDFSDGNAITCLEIESYSMPHNFKLSTNDTNEENSSKIVTIKNFSALYSNRQDFSNGNALDYPETEPFVSHNSKLSTIGTNEENCNEIRKVQDLNKTCLDRQDCMQNFDKMYSDNQDFHDDHAITYPQIESFSISTNDANERKSNETIYKVETRKNEILTDLPKNHQMQNIFIEDEEAEDTNLQEVSQNNHSFVEVVETLLFAGDLFFMFLLIAIVAYDLIFCN